MKETSRKSIAQLHKTNLHNTSRRRNLPSRILLLFIV